MTDNGRMGKKMVRAECNIQINKFMWEDGRIIGDMVQVR